MTQNSLTDSIIGLIREYIDNFDMFDSNPQIRVNPGAKTAALVNGKDMLAEIEDSNEAIEDAAGAEGDEIEDASDFQVKQNPDFYPVKSLLKTEADGSVVPDESGVDKIAAIYR